MEAKLVDIISKVKLDSRFVLGIDGLSRSGKTTFVKRVSELLKRQNTPFYVIHIDDHIVENERRYHTEHEEWFEYYGLQWDVEWMQEHVFKNLRISPELNLPFYNYESDSHVFSNIKLPKNCIIIIEGVFLQRREWRSFFDYVVFLDSPRDKRFSRETDTTQKKIGKFQDRYWKAEDYYLKKEEPLRRADLVIKERSHV